MLRSEIKQRLVQAWRSAKQEFLEELEKIPLSSEIKQRLIQAWKSGKQSFLEDVERMKTEIEEIIRMPLGTKITMLGTSKTGKTCYMIGMINYMQIKGSNGFTITSADYEQFILLEKEWDKMFDMQGSERWPPGNDVSVEYSFNYNYAAKTFAQFDWLDYRGGAWEDPKSDERKSLVERLCGSDCVFVCLSAEYLAKGAIAGALKKARMGTINPLLTEIAAKVNPTSENPFPVAIVVTKADLLTNFDGSIQEDAINIVKQFFANTLFADSFWLTAIIPVSLGKELAQHPDSGELDPVGVHLPITFAVLCKLIKQRNGLAKKPKGDWSWLSSIIGTQMKDKEQTDLKNRIERLDEELASVPIFAGEQQISSLLKWAKM